MPPIFSDDFESYSIGQQPPFGNWKTTSAPSPFCLIVAGGPNSSTKAFQIFQTEVYYEVAIGLASFTVYFNNYISSGPGVFFRVVNAVYPFSGTGGIEVLRLRTELDSTFSIFCGTDLLGNTLSPCDFSTWNFLQLNIEFSFVTIGSDSFLTVHAKLANEGNILIDNTITTTINLNTLVGGVPAANLWMFNPGFQGGVILDNFTLDNLQSIPTFPNPGTPLGRMTQEMTEVAVLPDSGKVRKTQGTTELAIRPNDGRVRKTQGICEVVYQIVLPTGGWEIYEL